MTLRPRRIPRPPPQASPEVANWMNEVTEAFNAFPVSYFSTSDGPNESAVTAPQGFLGIEIGSSSTRFWVKDSGSTSTGWKAFAPAAPTVYGDLNHDPEGSVITVSGVTTRFQQFSSLDASDHAVGLSTNTFGSGITFDYAGAYHINFSWTGAATAGATQVFFELYLNGTALDHGTSVYVQNANDVESVAFSSIHTISSNDTLAVYFKSDQAGGADIGTRAASLGVHRIF